MWGNEHGKQINRAEALRRRIRLRRLRRLAEVVVLATCLILFAIVIRSAVLESGIWSHSERADVPVTILDTKTYLEGTEQIEGYGGVRRTYLLPPLPEAAGYQIVAIWLVHSYIEVWSGDTLLYESREPEEPHIGHTPGCYWAMVPLSNADAGDRLRLVVTPAYVQTAESTPQVYISTIKNIIRSRLNGERSLLIISLFCLIEGLLFAIFTPIFRVPGRTGKSIFYMGLMIANLGLWKLSDLPVLSLVFPQASLVFTYLSMLSLMLSVPSITCFLFWRGERGSKVYSVLCEAFLTLDIVLIIMHICGLGDLRQNLSPILVMLVVALAIILERSIFSLKDNLTDWQTWAFIFMSLASLIDFVVYYYISNSLHLGITLTLMFFYGITNGVLAIHNVYVQKRLLQQRELDLKSQRVALMMSQIRPHFLYNTLNTISALCMTDGAEAKSMIHDLSGYLRLNFENIDSVAPVPFTEELEHTKFYLSIEKRRFGDAIGVVYDIKTENFNMPALSLQPLVENAVRHGIRKTKGSGTVTIRTWEEDNKACLLVEDDGSGFDTKEWEAAILFETEYGEESERSRHVGLANVRSRIRDMCDGEMEIDSRPGEGTRVMLRFPLYKLEKNKN